MTGDARREGLQRGMRMVLSIPGAVLFASFFGFGAFARESGLDLVQAVFAAGIFALPGQVVLADEWATGTGLAAAFLAVTLTAIRLLPLTVALLPVIREERTPLWQQLVLSHLVAITVWVEAMRHAPALPRAARIPFFAGMGIALVPAVLLAAVCGHVAAGVVPEPLAAGLMFLTPLYFLLSMLAAAREGLDFGAIAIGLLLGPVFFLTTPGIDLLLTGLVGGSIAYGAARWRKR